MTKMVVGRLMIFVVMVCGEIVETVERDEEVLIIAT
jgi:hypothetical protein